MNISPRIIGLVRGYGSDLDTVMSEPRRASQTAPMITQQLLLILHRCRELQIRDVDRWPQFLFGKDLEQINEAEAARLLAHLETQMEQETAS